MQIISHEEALTILARSIDPRDPASMLEAVELLSGVCLVPPDGFVKFPSLFPLVSCFTCFFLDFRHERVLEGITICGEMREQERFSPIVQGIVMDDPNMKVRPWPFTLSITA